MKKHRPHKKEKVPTVYIYGKHALTEALAQRKDVVEEVFLAPQVDDQHLFKLLAQSGAHVSALSADALEREVGAETSHQGVIARINPERLMLPFEAFIESLPLTNAPALVLLDEVHDPQNVGAVIRSAAAFGVSGVLMPEHNQAQVTGAVVKVSAGMAFRVPLVRIKNVNQTIRILKDAGFWIYGLDMKGAPVHHEQFEKPTVLVLGNEAKGIRTKTLELCDIPLSIPMHPRAESLNAATAAAIVMHQWSVRHLPALQ